MNTVEYREIADFPGYRVGSDGSVWYAWITCRAGRKLTDRWKQMKPGTHHKGYLYVNLTPPAGGKYKTFRVHRLVLAAFVGPCPDGMECRHLNGIKADCRLENLAWGTQEENRSDNSRLNAYQCGETHHYSKLTEKSVRRIRERHAKGGIFLRELAEQFGITLGAVHAIVHRHSWKHVA
jgi:hypothetical protein